jgi:hypothetical protein
MPNITSIPAPRVPFIDERTGLISREWYRFMLNLFTLTGSGTSDLTITDLAIAPNPVDPLATVGSLVDQAQLSTVVAQYSQFLDDLSVQPVMQPPSTLPDDLSPRDELGTMAAQNAANVNITGGTISGITFGGFPAGTVAAPSLYWTTDTATGFYRIGSNNIGFSYNGTKLLDFLSTGLAITGAMGCTGVAASGTTGANGRYNLARSSDGTYVSYITLTGAGADPTLDIYNGRNSATNIYSNGAVVGSFTASGLGVTGAFASNTVQPVNAGGYLSSDGSAGYTGTVTTALLVGKTITFKDGIVVSFA